MTAARVINTTHWDRTTCLQLGIEIALELIHRYAVLGRNTVMRLACISGVHGDILVDFVSEMSHKTICHVVGERARAPASSPPYPISQLTPAWYINVATACA